MHITDLNYGDLFSFRFNPGYKFRLVGIERDTNFHLCADLQNGFVWRFRHGMLRWPIKILQQP